MNRQRRSREKLNISVGVEYIKNIGKNKQVGIGFKSVFSNRGKLKHFLTTSYKSKRLGVNISYKL